MSHHQSAEQMKHLEEDGERKVAELMKTNNVTEQTLMNIINGGNDEFRKIYGRDMTYAEMRSIYGWTQSQLHAHNSFESAEICSSVRDVGKSMENLILSAPDSL